MKIKVLDYFEGEISSEELKTIAKLIIPSFIIDKVGIISDNVKHERIINQDDLQKERYLNYLSNLEICRKKIIDYGINQEKLNPINIKIATPILEYMSLESSSDLQEKRANLLLNASLNNLVQVTFAEVLKELDSVDIQVLNYIYESASLDIENGVESEHSMHSYNEIQDVLFTHKKIKKEFDDIKIQNITLSVDKCFRMRLLNGLIMVNSRGPQKDNKYFQLTYLGEAFIKACKLGE